MAAIWPLLGMAAAPKVDQNLPPGVFGFSSDHGSIASMAETVHGQGSVDVEQNQRCRVCAAPLPATARFCSVCKNYQRFVDRLLGGLSLQALVAVVPVATLAVAFLNQNIVVPYSRLTVNVSRCTQDEVVLALSNSGTRTAIVDGGSARFIPAKADFDRVLRPPGAAFTPVVIKPGEAVVTRFAFVDVNGEDPLPVPQLPDPQVCRYSISLSTLEFGGRRAAVDGGTCRC